MRGLTFINSMRVKLRRDEKVPKAEDVLRECPIELGVYKVTAFVSIANTS